MRLSDTHSPERASHRAPRSNADPAVAPRSPSSSSAGVRPAHPQSTIALEILKIARRNPGPPELPVEDRRDDAREVHLG